ncbi:hypothetical protein Cni_G27163 [Canna indica]|uniref:1-phosphatidylinositol phosphodiesterase n=1 Tax=Canna indica TaxID=4628 RepID=A0AAQ3L4F5_9LILI|nr:hypothetical protein Cni_G27163 [Canna indica]
MFTFVYGEKRHSPGSRPYRLLSCSPRPTTTSPPCTSTSPTSGNSVSNLSNTVAEGASNLRQNVNNIIDHQHISTEKKELQDLHSFAGDAFPGSDFHPVSCKTWMSELGRDRLRLNQIIRLGSHDSAMNDIDIHVVTRPFTECQTIFVYEQLVLGARVLDVRVEKEPRITHGILKSYSVDIVLDTVK